MKLRKRVFKFKISGQADDESIQKLTIRKLYLPTNEYFDLCDLCLQAVPLCARFWALNPEPSPHFEGPMSGFLPVSSHYLHYKVCIQRILTHVFEVID